MFFTTPGNYPFRLPTVLLPILYNLSIQVDFDPYVANNVDTVTSLAYTGQVIITVQALGDAQPTPLRVDWPRAAIQT